MGLKFTPRLWFVAGGKKQEAGGRTQEAGRGAIVGGAPGTQCEGPPEAEPA